MDRPSKTARYNVISMRLSVKERGLLDAIVERNRSSITNIMREAIELYLTRNGLINSINLSR